MVASVAWALALSPSPRPLSAANLVTRLATALAWIVVCILAFAAFQLRNRDTPLSVSSSTASSSSVQLDRPVQLLLAASGIMAFIVMLLAFVAAPSTWDPWSITCHAPFSG